MTQPTFYELGDAIEALSQDINEGNVTFVESDVITVKLKDEYCEIMVGSPKHVILRFFANNPKCTSLEYDAEARRAGRCCIKPIYKDFKENDMKEFYEVSDRPEMTPEEHAEWYAKLKRENEASLREMKAQGLFELNWDVLPETRDTQDLHPIKLSVVKLGDFTTFAACLSELGVLKSIKEGKRNGWNKPLELGDHLFKKKTWVVRVIKD